MAASLQTSFRLVRVVPFDLGHNISPGSRACLADCFKKMPEFRNTLDDLPWGGSDVSLACHFQADDRDVDLYIFDEGVGVFVVQEKEQLFESVDDFDPEIVNRAKSAGNREILAGRYCCSSFLFNVIRESRVCLSHTKLRVSAAPDFEHGGLSYVFTYGILKCYHHEFTKAIEQKVTLCLFPSHHRTDTIHDFFARISEHVGSIESMLEDRGAPESLAVLEKAGDLLCAASWSSLIIVGNVTHQIERYYKLAQINLQRIWFYTYIVGKSLDNVSVRLKEISTAELLEMQEHLAEMMFKVRKLDAIFSSISNNRDFRVYDGLRKSSRLDRLLSSIEVSSKFIIEQVTLRVEQNRVRSSKFLELIVLLLAGTQAFSSYQQLKPLNWIEATAIAIALLAVVILIVRHIRGR